MRVGVLLANRHGPLNAMEYTEFVNAMQSLAEQLSVLADTPDMMAVLERARDLDDRCASLDAQLGLGVEAPEPLGIADLARLAAQTGCVERGNNRYARLGPDGRGAVLSGAGRCAEPVAAAARRPARAGRMRPLARDVRVRGDLRRADRWRARRRLRQARCPRRNSSASGSRSRSGTQSLDAAGFPAGSALALRLFN